MISFWTEYYEGECVTWALIRKTIMEKESIQEIENNISNSQTLIYGKW